MGYSYNHHTIVGTFINGKIHDLYLFLETNGYPLTEEQKEEIEDGGQATYDIVDALKFKDISIINLNSWSGQDYVIGYHVSKKSQTNTYAKKFAKYFPNVKAEYHDFIEVC